VVFVVSPEAVKSDRCVWEVDRTIELSKRLLPVIFKPVPEYDIPKKLSRLQFVRFDTGRGITRPLAELAEALRQDLDWIREHTRLGEIATRWDRRKRPEALLLRGDDLEAAKAWMATRKVGAPEITDAQRALISVSEEAEAKRLGNEREQLEREKAQVAEIKAAQARTARLQRITRWAFAAVAAVILIAGGIVGWLQWDKARQLARQEVALAHAQANILAELSAAKLSNSDFDSALRLASRGTRIDLALPADETRTSPATFALTAAVSEADWRFALGGHDSAPSSVAFSPDGSRIVTASKDKTARIWDAASAKEIAVLRGHDNRVWSAAFSSDGSRIVTASDDKTARIWDVATAKEIAVLRGHDNTVNSAAFSPDGSRIVTASYDETARIWEAASGKEMASLRGHDSVVWSAAFSRDGARFGRASLDKTARIWDAASAKEIAALRGHVGRVYSAAFSPDGSRIVTASEDGTARIWEAASAKEITALRGHYDPVSSAAFSPDGSRIVTASDDKISRIWDAPLQRMDAKGLLGQACTRLAGVTELTREEMRLAGYPERMPQIDVCKE